MVSTPASEAVRKGSSPIAASLALAAGAIKIAAIKKQQQASEAQGYSEGGYTPKGRKDQEVGVVHAGEWVASQNSAMVEHTRRIAAGETAQHVVVQNMPAEQSGALDKSTVADLSSTIASLNSRLNEPFVTVNTITGDQGIKKAQDEYARLIRNKTPKSRR